MKKTHLLLLLITMSIFSCVEGNTEIDFAMLKEKVNKSENFIRYANAQNEMVKSGVLQQISFRNLDRKMIKENMPKVKTAEDLKSLYAEAGMIGGDKLAVLQFELDNSLKALVKEIPELKLVSKPELELLITVESTLNKSEVDKQILKN